MKRTNEQIRASVKGYKAHLDKLRDSDPAEHARVLEVAQTKLRDAGREDAAAYLISREANIILGLPEEGRLRPDGSLAVGLAAEVEELIPA